MTQANTTAHIKNVVLVHGGFVDGSGWAGIYQILKKRGFDVSVVQNPTLSLDPTKDVHELFTYPFMVNALEAATIVAVLAAVVGWYMVLRRQSFAGHTLSVMAFPGATGAALAGLPTSLGYYVACAIGRCDPDDAMRHIWRYLAALLVGLIIVAAIPWISIGFL